MNWFTSIFKRLWHWLSRKPKKITIPVTIVIVGVIALGGYWVTHFYNYMQDDPEFCNSCHIMEQSWDRWATSEHKDIGCHSCHHQSLFAGAKLILDFALGSFERVERHANVPDDACEQCHESSNLGWIQVAATAGHKEHAEQQNIACVKCHSVTVHRFQAPGQICSVCHQEKHIEVPGMAEMHCTTCHNFLVEGEELFPHRQDCLDCHQALASGEITWPADAPMQYPCGDCHQPHQQAEPVVECLDCHTVEGMHLEGAHNASSCLVCHKPHEWQVTGRETCLSCHPGKTEHFAGTLCGSCHTFPAR